MPVNRFLSMRDLKYTIAYLLPASTFLALSWQGPWSWATVVLAFGILPTVELFAPKSVENVPKDQEESRSRRLIFDLMLYLNAPLLFLAVGWYLWSVAHLSLSVPELLGLTFSVGIMAGACGINVAHELGHRDNKWEQRLAQLMLLPSLYQHFFVEHNRGHHKNVATDQDPASARLGENLYRFWVRSIVGGWRSAWALEKERLAKLGEPSRTWANLMWRFSAAQAAWLLAVWAWSGWETVLAALAVALVSVLLLESVNYIEHYGLRRQLLPSGRPEPVSPLHSWNSDHEIGRIFLYELTRHSDHHFKSTRKYQILRHMDESPQLPFGYPMSIVLALFPPVWFRVMDKRAVLHLAKR